MLFRTSRHVFFVPLRSRSRYSGFSFRFRLFVCLFDRPFFFVPGKSKHDYNPAHDFFFVLIPVGAFPVASPDFVASRLRVSILLLVFQIFNELLLNCKSFRSQLPLFLILLPSNFIRDVTTRRP